MRFQVTNSTARRPCCYGDMRKRFAGITLIELMVVLVVVAILAAIAVPSYRDYVMRANRADATAALLRIAAAQEKFYLQNNRYATNAQLGAAPPNGLGIAGTERGYYTIRIDNATTTGFTAVATASAAGGQQRDTRCRSFSINETGTRSATNSEGSTSATITAECWR